MQPTQEHQDAADLFSTRGNLRIDAYAGAGKTSTLVLLAESRRAQSLYLAFNCSIAAEAKSRFPAHVRCATSHSLAFRSVRRHLGYPEWKLTEKLSAQGIADGFRMPDTISFHCGIGKFCVYIAQRQNRFRRRSKPTKLCCCANPRRVAGRRCSKT